MRKIKFRIWYKIEKRWLDPWAEEDPTLSLKDYGKGCEVFLWDREREDYSTINSQMDDVVIQQYTGVDDKNGVEIYEGDILKCKYTSGLASVDFNDTNFGRVLGWNLIEHPIRITDYDCVEENAVTDYYYGRSPSSSDEVIGNILEGIKDAKIS